jgi:acetyl-CoA carboxylase biotin carboxyl carrier protein
MNIDFEQLKELLEIFSQNDISELTVESGEERITVKKPGHHLDPEFAPHMVAPMPAPHIEHAALPHITHALGHPGPEPGVQPHEHPHPPTPTPPEPPAKDNFLKVTSPMVGTFYRSASPTKPPFVEEGDIVTVGQTICIIEAMKLMNDLPSEVAGRIVEILASNGATVEYGQPLFLIDPENTQ